MFQRRVILQGEKIRANTENESQSLFLSVETLKDPIYEEGFSRSLQRYTLSQHLQVEDTKCVSFGELSYSKAVGFFEANGSNAKWKFCLSCGLLH